MSSSETFWSRIFKWIVPASDEDPYRLSLEAAPPEDGSKPNGSDSVPPDSKPDRDHERELLLMLHICC